MLFVPDAKYYPRKLVFAQISFVAESRKILSQLINIEIRFCFFKLNNFAFRMFPKFAEYVNI